MYSSATYKFEDIITELSGYDVWLDGDISVDEDKNGLFDDDFMKI